MGTNQNDIFERIEAAQEKFRTQSMYPPNVIYMSMADYRALCEWAITAAKVRPIEGGRIGPDYKENAGRKPIEILGMRIVKKAGAKLECTFEETQPTKEYMTMEAVRKAADSMRKVGVKLPRCGHGLIRAYCPLCEKELLRQFNQNVLKPEL